MSKKQVAGYILDKRIGKGSYATVWKGRVEGAPPEETVAVKVISRQTVTETSQLRQEVEVLRRISHDNIVRFRDLKKSAAHFYLVLEFCAGGDLSQFLREKGRVGEEVARRFLTQIAAGLCVLHKENVLHRDLKPQNILLSDSSDSPVLKIADFGFARALQPQDMAATVCGSPLYMAPEILRHEPYDARADLWSVGAILYELLLGRPPFTGANPMQLLANIEKNDRVSFEGVTLSSEGQDFLRALLMRNPKERLSSLEFTRHAYVRLGSRTSSPLLTPAPGPHGASVVAAAASPGPVDAMAGSTEAIVYGGDVPGEWCLPSELQDTSLSSPHSRSGGATPSPAASPLTCRSPELGSPRESAEGGSFHLSCEVVQTGHDASELAAAAAAAAGSGAAPPAAPVPSSAPAAEETHMGILISSGAVSSSARAGGGAGACGTPGAGRPKGVEEEYVVVTAQQPASAFARGRGPTPRAAASSFCGNLSRIAHALEHLASRLQDSSPLECLALLLRALGLIEKALNVSLAEEETHEPLRKAFRRLLESAESAGKQVRANSQVTYGADSLKPPPARPNDVVFEFAVQQAKEAAVALSKSHEKGGWEAAVHEKLSLALLLLDLLASEAGGEDSAAIAAYTAPISRLLFEVEARLGKKSPQPLPAAVPGAMATQQTQVLLGC